MTTKHEISLEGLSVCIGMPVARDMHPLVVKSLFSTLKACGEAGIKCDLAMVYGNSVIQWARDEVVDLLLDSEANRFFFIDSDIIWEAKDFFRLLALSTKRDIVCSPYVAKKDEPSFYLSFGDKNEFTADEYGLFQVEGTGLGFTIINRRVVEEISEKAPKVLDQISGNTIPSIFRFTSEDGERRGEDILFFRDLASLGYKIYMEPTLKLGHAGSKIYRGKFLDALTKV